MHLLCWGFPGGASGKESACQCRKHKRQVRSLGWEDSLEWEMASHSSILAWEIPWTEEPGGLQSIRLQVVRHNGATKNRFTLLGKFPPYPRVCIL